MRAASATRRLNNGALIPLLGLGTWKSEPGEVGEAVSVAIDAGYRHIDGAYSYRNEAEVGAALKKKIDEGAVTRNDLFIVSKLWCTFHAPEDVKPSLMETLSALQLTYLDLYLIHFPVGFQNVSGEIFPVREGRVLVSETDYMETWRAMERLVDEGLVKSIGVSNFNVSQLQRLLSMARIIPAVNQVELHPYLTQPELVEFCASRDITVTAFSPLGSPGRPQSLLNDESDPKDLLKDPVVKVIAENHEKSVAQVLLRFHVQRNIVTIPKSVSPARIQENAEIFDFELTEEEMESLIALNKNWRLCRLIQRPAVGGVYSQALPHWAGFTPALPQWAGFTLRPSPGLVVEVTERVLEAEAPPARRAREMVAVPLRVFINPRLRVLDSRTVLWPEACHSLPGFAACVARHRAVEITGLNELGESVTWEATGWAARIIQHEMDHLNGQLYIDKMDSKTFVNINWMEENE